MAYTDVENQACELDTLLQEFRQALKKVNTFNPNERPKRLQRCALIAQQIRTAKDAYVLELRALPKEEVPNYKSALEEKLIVFKNLLVEYEYKKSQINKEQLVQEVLAEEANPDQMSREQLIKQGDHVQDQTQESIDRMQKMVQESEQVGGAILVKMDDQTNQMMRIQGNMDDVTYNIQRAKGTMSSIARSAATDICLIIECVCIIVFIIVSVCLVVI